jgi:hypothetical protein
MSLPIALALALLGGGPVKDVSTFTLRTRGAARLPRTSLAQDFALAPIDPVSSDGITADIAALNANAAPAESIIKTAPTRFHGQAPQATPPPALSDGSVSSQGARQGGTWAVVIGINDYPGSENDLNSAVNDADDVVQALAGFGVASDHVLELRDGQVTSRTLLQSVSWLAAHAGPDAVAGFFYAGHVRKSAQGNEEIVTSDGSPVSDSELANALNRVQATRSWVAIAACYGAGFDEVLRPGRVLTAAAGRNSMAYENSAIGRSYMVEYMVRQAMIQGHAAATVQTAFNYAVDRISKEHPGREPVELDDSNGALDLRPPGAPHTSESQPQPEPDPQPQPASPPPSSSEPPASDRSPSGSTQHCYTKGLVRYCNG